MKARARHIWICLEGGPRNGEREMTLDCPEPGREYGFYADAPGQPEMRQCHWYKIVTPRGAKPARAVWDRADAPVKKPPPTLIVVDVRSVWRHKPSGDSPPG